MLKLEYICQTKFQQMSVFIILAIQQEKFIFLNMKKILCGFL